MTKTTNPAPIRMSPTSWMSMNAFFTWIAKGENCADHEEDDSGSDTHATQGSPCGGGFERGVAKRWAVL